MTFPYEICDAHAMSWYLPGLVLVIAGGWAFAQCPNNSSPHFSCESAGGNTQITLFDDAQLEWDSFSVPANGSFDVTSSGGFFSSVHSVRRSLDILGSVSADGPLSLISPRRFQIGPDASIVAPQLTLSALPGSSLDGFQGRTSRGQLRIDGEVMASAGDVDIYGARVTVGALGSVEAPQGKVRSHSLTSQTASPTVSPELPDQATDSRALFNNTGRVEAPIVEIYSEGEILNGGQLVAMGPGNRIQLTAQFVTHTDALGSVIVTDDLRVPPFNIILEGPLVSNDDGINPGGVSTTLGFPDIEKGIFASGQRTKLKPTQFSASNLSRSRLPSAVAVQKKRRQTQTRLVTRGAATKKKKVSKRSFFGVVTRQ